MKKAFYVLATGKFKEYYQKLEKSFKHFNPTEELILFEEKDLPNDPQIYYRSAPYFAKKLFNDGYDAVVKLDTDQIITGNLSHLWDIEADVGTVLNDPSLPIKVWDISTYANNGLVVIKNKDFIDHWGKLCYSSHFNSYQYREQDLLSILTSDYFNYKVIWLDIYFNKVHGEWAKPFWPKTFIENNKIYANTPRGKKELVVVHFGGGHNAGDKMNYRIRFPEPVIKFIDNILK